MTGTLPDGATYVMDVPADWNGTVLLFSHGLVVEVPGDQPNPARNAPGWGRTKDRLLAEGYALIGSSYVSPGWVVDTAVDDQLATLRIFQELFGPARRSLAWGESLGGMITTKLAETHGEAIDGSLSLCGTQAGGVARWNNQLDLAFALRTLLTPDADTPLTGFADRAEADASATALKSATRQAQDTAAGRARIALAAALAGVAGYNSPSQQRPGPHDWAVMEANQYAAISATLLSSTTQWRQDAESHAGGSMSWNTGVDYAAMLARSPYEDEAKALYKAAGLSLTRELAALNAAPRIPADAPAIDFMARTASFSGNLTKPQLNVHNVHDGLVPVQNQHAYRETVRRAGTTEHLRQAYIARAGHCNFTEDEALTAVRTLNARVASGSWGDTSARALNESAAAHGATTETAYVEYGPPGFPRPYDLAGKRADRP
ncbi:hypothetical protein [Streptomyces sp. NA04227]|uniref:hypothetical protein n=1 Tax=Streptomyces sp. NA04227 TaxID=2742136 RepID=UPI0020CA8813|nr:hypothetical protein [Streptomyces sp. NA04227]